MAGMDDVAARVAREKSAVAAHRASLHGGSLPPPAEAPNGTFLHGFLLPFSLIAATLRDRELRRPFVKVTVVRVLIVAAITAVGCGSESPKPRREPSAGPVVVHHRRHAAASGSSAGAPVASGVGVHMQVNIPGVHVNLDQRPGTKSEVKVLGTDIPVEDVEVDANDDRPPGQVTQAEGLQETREKPGLLASGWARVLAFFAMVASISGFVVALSRRYDDRLGYFVATRIALVKPEDETPKEAKIGPDFKWLKKKAKERIREMIAFATGIPALALLHIVPTAGPWLFKLAMIGWGWYWLGVFTAAKNDHSLVDAKTAPPPAVVRGAQTIAGTRGWTAPLRVYVRLWAWLTTSFHSPAAFFERAPAAFLGLALARAILSLPGLYLLAKPIVPVAAGRLCAECDPLRRFDLPTDTATPDAVAVPGAPGANSALAA